MKHWIVDGLIEPVFAFGELDTAYGVRGASVEPWPDT